MKSNSVTQNTELEDHRRMQINQMEILMQFVEVT